MTLVPLKLYFNEKGRAKVELALARGKKLYDKRDTEKKRSWDRERGRLMRQKGLKARPVLPVDTRSLRDPRQPNGNVRMRSTRQCWAQS